MAKKSIDLRKRECINKLFKFLKDNREVLLIYKDVEDFKQNIEQLYKDVRSTNYDTLEFNVPENIKANENSLYYYFSKSNTSGIKYISIINKNLKEFYFLTINYDSQCEISKYYKNEKNKVIVLKSDNQFSNSKKNIHYKKKIYQCKISN